MKQYLEKIFIYSFFLLFPSQLSLHFWPWFSYINGIKVDYLSPTLYFADLIIICLLVLKFPHKVIFNRWILFIILLNIIFSFQPIVAIYSFARISLYYLLIKYLVQNSSVWISRFPKLLSITVLWAGLIALSQFYLQHSLGGLFILLGERPLSLIQLNIAKISLGNLGLFLRPYSVFPHPNALAGFLLLAFWLLISQPRHTRLIKFTISVIPLFILFTFSRAVILTLVITSLIYYFNQKKSKTVLALIVLFLVAINLSLNFGATGSLSQRLMLSDISLNLIESHPLYGIGLGNFPLDTYQPVHNLFLLLISQLGLPVGLILLYLLLNYFRSGYKLISLPLKLAIVSILISGLFDHYWLTSPANLILISILTGYIIVISKPKSAQKI